MFRHAFAFLLCSLFISAGAVAQKAQGAGEEPAAVVKKLYAAQKAGTPVFNQTSDRTAVDRFFAKDLANLIWKDAVSADGEIGALDFDPLYGSQDPQITNFVVGETGWGGDKKFGGEDDAVVQVTFRDAGNEQMVSFQFERDKKKTWKISDIRYPDDRTLADILRAGDGNEGGTAAREQPRDTKAPATAGAASYQLFKGTNSPDGRYAVAWGIKGADDLTRKIKSGANIDEEPVENYIVDVRAGTIVGTLADSDLWIDAKEDVDLRGRTLATMWGTGATSSLLIAGVDGKWGNVYLRAIKLENGEVAGTADISGNVEKEVFKYLASNHSAKYKRAKEFVTLYLTDFKAEGENSFSLTASAGITKQAPDGVSLDVRVPNVRFSIEGDSNAPKFTILTVGEAEAPVATRKPARETKAPAAGGAAPDTPASTRPVEADALVNGNFATGDFTGWVTNVTPVSGPYSGPNLGVNKTPYKGGFRAGFNGGDTVVGGSIAQTFETVPGGTYQLTFDYLTGGGPGKPQKMNVSVSNSDFKPVQVAPDRDKNATYEYSFTAKGTSSTITFKDDPKNSTVSIDGLVGPVQIVPIPQSASTDTITKEAALAAVRKAGYLGSNERVISAEHVADKGIWVIYAKVEGDPNVRYQLSDDDDSGSTVVRSSE